MYDDQLYQMMCQRQAQLDALNLHGLHKHAAFDIIDEHFPDYDVVYLNGRQRVTEKARPRRIWLWLDERGYVWAAVHG